MRLAHTFVARRAVLQIVLVAVLLPVVPLHGHLCGMDGVVVFGIEVVAVITGIYGLYVTVKIGKGFGVALLIGERQADLRERMVGFQSRKNKDVVAQCRRELGRRFMRYGKRG